MNQTCTEVVPPGVRATNFGLGKPLTHGGQTPATDLDLGKPNTHLNNYEEREDFGEMFESRISAGATEELPGWEKPRAKTVAWSYCMEGHAQKCVEKYCELANKMTEQFFKVSSLCLDMITISTKRNLNQLENCQKYAHTLSLNACTWHEWVDLTFYGQRTNLLDTKWTGACDKRLARLISYIHHTSDYRQYSHVRNTAQHCRLGPFQDSDFAGDLEDSKATSGRILCIFWESNSRSF